jgi:hypothetical protein
LYGGQVQTLVTDGAQRMVLAHHYPRSSTLAPLMPAAMACQSGQAVMLDRVCLHDAMWQENQSSSHWAWANTASSGMVGPAVLQWPSSALHTPLQAPQVTSQRRGTLSVHWRKPPLQRPMFTHHHHHHHLLRASRDVTGHVSCSTLRHDGNSSNAVINLLLTAECNSLQIPGHQCVGITQFLPS